MDQEQKRGIHIKTFERSPNNDEQYRSRVFEVLLTEDQSRQLQKLLPAGYSVVPLGQIARIPIQRVVPQEHFREPVIVPVPVDVPPKRKAYREAEQTIRGVSEFVRKARSIIDLLKKHPSSEPFLFPVDPIELGLLDYFDVIKEPMDLSTVYKNLMQDAYQDMEDFQADVRRIWSNALAYNLPGSEICQMTEEMGSYFESLLREDHPRNEAVKKMKTQISKLSHKLSSFEGTNPNRFKNSKTVGQGRENIPLSQTEKRNLSSAIKKLPAESLWDVWNIIAPYIDARENEEIEFDIETLPAICARKLEVFVFGKGSRFSKKGSSLRKARPDNQENEQNQQQADKNASEAQKGQNEDLLHTTAPPAGEEEDDGGDNSDSFISGLDESDS
jgi:hypothetical protein